MSVVLSLSTCVFCIFRMHKNTPFMSKVFFKSYIFIQSFLMQISLGNVQPSANIYICFNKGVLGRISKPSLGKLSKM